MKKIRMQFDEILWLFKCVTPGNARHLAYAFFASFTPIFFNIIFAETLKSLYSVIVTDRVSELLQIICFYILAIAGVFLYNCIMWRIFTNSTAKVTGYLRKILFSRLCDRSAAEMDGEHSGEIMSLFTYDINMAQNVYVNIRYLMSCILMGIIASVLVLLMSVQLGLLIIFLAFVQLFINLFVVGPLEKHSITIREKTAGINNAISDIISNNMIIRLYASEKYYTDEFCKLNKSLYTENMKLYILNAITDNLNFSCAILGYIIVLLYGGYLIGTGQFRLGDLLFITQMRLAMVEGVLAIGSYAVQLQPSVVSTKKLREFLNNLRLKSAD